MLAPMIREKPEAIAKNETREERSRIVGKEVKSTLQHEPGPAGFSLLFAIIRWPVPSTRLHCQAWSISARAFSQRFRSISLGER
jgi:hypothetical protein